MFDPKGPVCLMTVVRGLGTVLSYFLGPGTVGRGVLRQGTVAHGRTQAQERNVDMNYNHVLHRIVYSRHPGI